MSVEHRGTKALELWTRRVTEGYDGVCITNMTTSWRDGLAFCALIHHFRSDLIDVKGLKSENILENNALAFRVAEQHLGIPALLDAEDMLQTEIPDRLSILTYVSQFYQAFSALGLIGPGGRRSPVSPTVANNAKNTSITTLNSPNKQAPIIPTPRAKPISQPPVKLQTKMETGFKTDKVTVGARGRREECVACHKQVFLAERIVVGFPGQLRHRTCFRCDRCAAQLTLASYYETEKGQFCCETCPDEERTLSSGEEDETTDKKIANSEKSLKGESSSDSESDSDSPSNSDLEENSSFREKNSRSATPPPPSPRTVFLNDSLEPSISSIDNFPPTKPPRISPPSTVKPSNFSQLSPALCGNVQIPPTNTAPVSPSPFSCEDAKGQETRPPDDALDTGQIVHKSYDDRKLQDEKEQLLDSAPKIDNICQIESKESIPDQKVKNLRSIFESKNNSLTSKEKNAIKTEYTSVKERNTNESNPVCPPIENVDLLKIEKLKDNDSSIDVPDNSNIRDSKESLNQINVCIDGSEIPDANVESSVHISQEETSLINSIIVEVGKPQLDDNDDNPSTLSTAKNNVSEEPLNVASESPDVAADSESPKGLESISEKEISKEIESDNQNNEENSKYEYPDELNPFDSDDAEEAEERPCTDSNKVQESTLTPDKYSKNKIVTTPFNPFDSDEDEGEEEEKKQIVEKKEKENPKKNLNPFWSDEEESDTESLPSKSKVKPPRPPPPTLRWETSPGMKKYILPSNPYEYRNQGELPPPSPSLSARSSSSDQSTLRLRKKLRQAPAPPCGGCSPSSLQNKSLIGVSGDEVTGYINDDALTAKMQKDLMNHTSKLKGGTTTTTTSTYQKEDQVAASLRGGITTPKSERGEWRRKKGPAPSRPVPQKRAIRKLPMRQVAQELCDIEVKQTELERQGVLLETAIREKTEGPGYKPYSNDSTSPEDSISTSSEPDKSYSSMNSTCSTYPSMEVEDMILQLFELVNEKNELFRRQTELMYLKREKRLEEEHAELEYQIRCLMLKPPSERSDDDVNIEEELIVRLLKVVEQRDAVVNCLEMERQREAIEDESIATHMIKYQEKHIEGIESDEGKDRTMKKKKKLRLIKKKKKGKTKEKVSKVDADKDVDETEVKKKKKNWFKKTTLGST